MNTQPIPRVTWPFSSLPRALRLWDAFGSGGHSETAQYAVVRGGIWARQWRVLECPTGSRQGHRAARRQGCSSAPLGAGRRARECGGQQLVCASELSSPPATAITEDAPREGGGAPSALRGFSVTPSRCLIPHWARAGPSRAPQSLSTLSWDTRIRFTGRLDSPAQPGRVRGGKRPRKQM